MEWERSVTTSWISFFHMLKSTRSDFMCSLTTLTVQQWLSTFSWSGGLQKNFSPWFQWLEEPPCLHSCTGKWKITADRRISVTSIYFLYSSFFCSSKAGSGARYHNVWLLQKLRCWSYWSKLPQAVVTWTNKAFLRLQDISQLKFANPFDHKVLRLFHLSMKR